MQKSKTAAKIAPNTALNILGFKRESGRIGIRNHVVILPLDDLSNAACEAVANNIQGTLAIPHAYGRLQFGEDLALHFRTLIGTGANPNVAAVVVIGIEPEWTRVIVDGIAKTGKPVCGFSIERHGDINTIAAASRAAKEYVHIASEYQREECPFSDVWVSHKCGESDTTSGIASNPTVGNFVDKTRCHGVDQLLLGDLRNHRRRTHLPHPGEQSGGRRQMVCHLESVYGRSHRAPQDFGLEPTASPPRAISPAA